MSDSPLRTPVLSRNVFRDAAQGDILQRTMGSSSERETPAAIPTGTGLRQPDGGKVALGTLQRQLHPYLSRVLFSLRVLERTPGLL